MIKIIANKFMSLRCDDALVSIARRPEVDLRLRNEINI